MAEISKIKLPSGNVYDIKDTVARQMISGGVSFIVAWDGNSAPVAANIPAGVVVNYNGTPTTGTLSADDAQAGAFYLVKSSTSTSEGPLDVYDEYVPVGSASEKSWEKIGDTQVDLSNVVTNVTFTKQTANVIGANSTFTVTNPSVDVTPSTTYVKGTASGANTAWNSKDSKTVVTGYASPTTDTFVKSVSAETGKNLVTTSIIPAGATEVDAITSVTDNKQKLATTTVIGVGSTTTTASKATAGTSQTTADGTGTVSTTNTDWLKDISVADEVLWIKAATMDTQTTTQYTFSDVTVPIKNNSSTTVATGSLTTTGSGADVMTSTTPSTTKVATKGTSTTVATGATSTTGQGDAVVTGVTIGSSASAITGLGSPSTASVIGASATFTITQPTIALATDSTSGTGKVELVDAIDNVTVTGTNVAWNNKDQKTVLTNATSVTPTFGGDNAQSVGDNEF